MENTLPKLEGKIWPALRNVIPSFKSQCEKELKLLDF